MGGTGDPSFSGEHGLRVRALVSVLNAAKDDARLRVCSGVSILTMLHFCSWSFVGAKTGGFRRQGGVLYLQVDV